MDTDQKALDVVREIHAINGDHLPGGDTQAKAGHQLIVARALKEAMSEQDGWEQLAYQFQQERDALAAHIKRIEDCRKHLEGKWMMPVRMAKIMDEGPAASLDERDARVSYEAVEKACGAAMPGPCNPPDDPPAGYIEYCEGVADVLEAHKRLSGKTEVATDG